MTVVKTLLEKIDSSCDGISQKNSVCNQVQRIISTRMYLGSEPVTETWVTGFGVPEIVSEYADTRNPHDDYREVLRKRLLQFEPRLKNVIVKNVNN